MWKYIPHEVKFMNAIINKKTVIGGHKSKYFIFIYFTEFLERKGEREKH